MKWSFSSSNFSKDVYFMSRADVSCCGRRGRLVKGWKMVGNWDEETCFLLILLVAKRIPLVIWREGLQEC
jgi:hypothetical protein